MRAVLWPDGPSGGVVDLGNLGGTGFNIQFDINNRGQVIGQSTLADNTNIHAFLWENGVMTDLGSLPGLPTSQADGINNQGQVVGFSNGPSGDASAVAVLWQNGTMTDLNTLVPADSLLFLMEAVAINDRGQIAGWGRLSSGDIRPFLLTPCNERDEGCEDDAAGTTTAGAAEMQREPASPDNPALRHQMLRPFDRRWMLWYPPTSQR